MGRGRSTRSRRAAGRTWKRPPRLHRAGSIWVERAVLGSERLRQTDEWSASRRDGEDARRPETSVVERGSFDRSVFAKVHPGGQRAVVTNALGAALTKSFGSAIVASRHPFSALGVLVQAP